MSAYSSKIANIHQHVNTCVAQFDLTPWATWDENLGMCVAQDGMQQLLSNVANMTAKGWVYIYATPNPYDESVINLHYQEALH
jgi:hypothetical protein